LGTITQVTVRSAIAIRIARSIRWHLRRVSRQLEVLVRDVLEQRDEVDLRTLTTSRSPADLPAFCPAIVEQFSRAREAARA
jgi:hypothetical protein